MDFFKRVFNRREPAYSAIVSGTNYPGEETSNYPGEETSNEQTFLGKVISLPQKIISGIGRHVRNNWKLYLTAATVGLAIGLISAFVPPVSALVFGGASYLVFAKGLAISGTSLGGLMIAGASVVGALVTFGVGKLSQFLCGRPCSKQNDEKLDFDTAQFRQNQRAVARPAKDLEGATCNRTAARGVPVNFQQDDDDDDDDDNKLETTESRHPSLNKYLNAQSASESQLDDGGVQYPQVLQFVRRARSGGAVKSSSTMQNKIEVVSHSQDNYESTIQDAGKSGSSKERRASSPVLYRSSSQVFFPTTEHKTSSVSVAGTPETSRGPSPTLAGGGSQGIL